MLPLLFVASFRCCFSRHKPNQLPHVIAAVLSGALCRNIVQMPLRMPGWLGDAD